MKSLCEEPRNNQFPPYRKQANSLPARQAAEPASTRCLDHAPGLFFTLRLEPDGRMAVPFLAGRLASLPGLGPESAADDIAPLLALFRRDDAVMLLVELQRSRREMMPCCVELRVGGDAGGTQAVMELKASPCKDADHPDTVEWHGFMHDISERKCMEGALRKSERDYRALAENLPTPIIRYEADGRFRYLNPAAEAVMGFKTEDLADQPLGTSGLLSPDVLERYRAAIRDVAATRVSREFDLVSNGPGQLEHYSMLLVPDTAGDGSTGVLAVGFDITARKCAENALREREDFLASLLDTIPLPVFYKDRQERYVGLNKAFEAYFASTRAQLVGKTLFDIQPREIAEIYQAKDRVLFEQGGIQHYEAPLVNQLGQLREAAFSRAVFTDKHGAVAGMIGVIQDITERKQAEADLKARYDEIVELNGRLEESARELEEYAVEIKAAQEQLKITEAWYRGILHSAPDGMMVISERGVITLVNSQLGKMFGYAEHELVGLPMEMLVPADLRQQHEGMRAGFTRSMEHGRTSRLAGNLRARRKDGSEFIVDVALSRLPDTDHYSGAICAAVRDVTERRRMEEALAAREQEFRSLAESSPDYIARFDREGRHRYLNTALFRYMDRDDAREILGKRPSETWPDGRFDAIEQAAAQAVESGSTITTEFCDLSAGEPCFHQIRVVPERDTAGRIIGTIAFGRDITAIRATERRLAHFINNLPGIAYTFRMSADGQASFPFTSPAIREIYGLAPDDVKDDFMPLHMLAHPEDRPRIDAAIAESARAMTPFRVEYRVCRPGQPQRWLEARSMPERGADGSILWHGLMLEITERKLAESVLEETRKRLQSVLRTIPDMVWLKDADGVYLACNYAFERLIGRLERDLIGKSDRDLFDAELAEFFREKDRAAIEARRICVNEEWVTYPDNGQRALLETRKVPVYGPDGEVTGVLGVARDVTERKQAEQKLQEALEFTEGVINAIPDILFEVDRHGTYLNVWTRNPDMLAAQRETLIGRTVHEVLSAEAAAAAMSAIEEADEKGVAYGKVLRIDLPAGPAWFEHSVSKKSGGAPGDTRYLVLSRDVTERKHMEAALALREREFRTLVENSTDAIARYGADFRRAYVNPALAALVEGGQNALIGTKPSECPGGPNAAVFERNLAKVFHNGQEIEFELKAPDKDGRELCSLVRLTPEFGRDGHVESILGVGRDITELHAVRQKIHQMAFYDPLTGLPNRALFNDRLRQMITDASWHSQLAGVMIIDMDRFKEVNDTMGHSVGDELLRQAAARLTASVRSYDTVARLGGDEFAILLPDVRAGADLGRIADKILAMFDERFLLDGKEVFVSCSIGIAVYPADSAEPGDLLKYADSAMYFAKRSGRNNFRFYSKELTATARERLMLESELRRAAERNELELYYQPKVLLQDGMVIGSEALLRWRHPQRGMVPPDQFIRVAEDSGLIVDLGKWVLREACRSAAEWNGEGKPLHKVAINLSPRQFQSADLVMSVAEILEETACRPAWIELEITESLLLDEDGKTLDMLSGLRSMGISIAIDDFGTGYSALSYLARFPIDTLKIDKSFIQSITTDSFRAELVKVILSIARNFNQEVVAEGVETVAQAAFLEAHGCRMVQGFLYSRPVPKAEISRLPRQFIHDTRAGRLESSRR